MIVKAEEARLGVESMINHIAIDNSNPQFKYGFNDT
jgi:hypothetical protein